MVLCLLAAVLSSNQVEEAAAAEMRLNYHAQLTELNPADGQ